MAGTDRRKAYAADHVDKGAPAVVLVRTQLGENIGAAARAMLNCGLADLRLVQPRDGWPNVKALGAASGADAVLSSTRVYGTVEEAVADLNVVHATTARPRELLKPELAPRESVAAMREAAQGGARLGLLFGPEKAGLKNEELVLADAIVRIPLNPAFASLNLAQAVLIMAYEWRLASGPLEDIEEPPPPTGSARPATKEEILHFFEHLEGALDERSFYPTPEMRPKMVQNMRTMFERISLTRQDVQTLRGVVRALTGEPPRRGPPPGSAD
ncbi:MAG: RNA methyltransferase [Rhodospirillales bacterium]|nr:RNA methyltransferase [Rhodospirillales bacterium]